MMIEGDCWSFIKNEFKNFIREFGFFLIVVEKSIWKYFNLDVIKGGFNWKRLGFLLVILWF